MQRLKRMIRWERGQALVEFALILPILLMIVMGIIDFGRMLYLYSQLSNGLREGARYGSLTGPDDTNPQYTNCAGIRQSVKDTLAIPLPDSELSITIAYDDGKTAYAFNCNGNTRPNPSLLSRGDRVLVSGTVKFAFLTPIISSFGPLDVKMTSARTILKGGTLVPDSK